MESLPSAAPDLPAATTYSKLSSPTTAKLAAKPVSGIESGVLTPQHSNDVSQLGPAGIPPTRLLLTTNTRLPTNTTARGKTPAATLVVSLKSVAETSDRSNALMTPITCPAELVFSSASLQPVARVSARKASRLIGKRSPQGTIYELRPHHRSAFERCAREDIGMEQRSEQLHPVRDARPGTAEVRVRIDRVGARGADRPRRHGAKRRAVAIRVGARRDEVEPARHHEQHVGIQTDQFLPLHGERGPACGPSDQVPARQPDHLRHPVARHER